MSEAVAPRGETLSRLGSAGGEDGEAPDACGDRVDVTGAVLHCPGGPGSFAAIVSQLWAQVVAVDPAYGPPPSARCRTSSRQV